MLEIGDLDLLARSSIGNEGESMCMATVENRMLSLNEDVLESVIMREEIRDKPVVIISIAGAYRKGKSFLLNFFLRYLRSKDKKEWMGPCDVPLTGFRWHRGSERVTTGIQLWSEPFVVEIRPGEEVAILLMDTQGVFDSRSTNSDWTTIFALSALVSSVVIYNLTGNIQEDDLQHLQLFADYGRTMIIKENGAKPYQDLKLLVRDWAYPDEKPYGAKGGVGLLKERITVDSTQDEELREARTTLKSCFNNISCYLMPHPGLQVQRDTNFAGCLSDIDQDFKVYVKSFVESVLKPQNLVVKEINGLSITGNDLFLCFKEYAAVFQSEERPEPTSVFRAIANASNLIPFEREKNSYIQKMEEVCKDGLPSITETELMNHHHQYKREAMDSFNKARKLGGIIVSGPYAAQLSRDLDNLSNSYLTRIRTRQEHERELARQEKERELERQEHEKELEQKERERVHERQEHEKKLELKERERAHERQEHEKKLELKEREREQQERERERQRQEHNKNLESLVQERERQLQEQERKREQQELTIQLELQKYATQLERMEFEKRLQQQDYDNRLRLQQKELEIMQARLSRGDCKIM